MQVVQCVSVDDGGRLLGGDVKGATNICVDHERADDVYENTTMGPNKAISGPTSKGAAAG